VTSGLPAGYWGFKADNLREGQLIAHFLMASYLYYHFDLSVIKDTEFDRICVRLREVFPQIQHPHKYLITEGDLIAASGFAIPLKKYPLMVCNAAWHWAESLGFDP
jgi:hypothetical protein